MRKIIEIRCPKCGEKLRIDLEKGKLINSEEEMSQDEKFSYMIEKLKKEKKNVQKKFEEAKKSLENRKVELERKFNKLKEKVKNDKE